MQGKKRGSAGACASRRFRGTPFVRRRGPPVNDRSAIDQWYRRLPRYLYVEDLIAGREVVEIGCGGGVGSDFLIERGAARVIGVDRDVAALEKARQRYAGAASFERWDKG